MGTNLEKIKALSNRQIKKANNRVRYKPNRKPAERLPHGSSFSVTYDAAVTTWRGTLTVPIPDLSRCEVFSSSHSTLFTLLSRLDDLYRAWKARNQKPVDPQP